MGIGYYIGIHNSQLCLIRIKYAHIIKLNEKRIKILNKLAL